MHHRPGPVLAPSPTVVVHDPPRGQIMREHAPGTPRPQEIEDPIQDLALGIRLRTSPRFRLWHQMFDQIPFVISEVGRVWLSRVHALHDTRVQLANASFLDTLLVPNDPDLDAIANELGDLPLALHLAGSYLAQYKHTITPAVYLSEIRRLSLQHPSLQGHGMTIRPTGHELHVKHTFELSYKQIIHTDLTNVLARTALAYASYLAPGELIPYELLLETHNIMFTYG